MQRDDACVEINKQNRLLDGVKAPNVNINSWYDVFKSLKEIDKIIIVENEFEKKYRDLEVDDDDTPF